MKANEMPAPDAIIEYEDGRTGVAMFFYGMPEDASASAVAEANGFDSKFITLEDDDREETEELRFRYEQGEDPFSIAKDWHPEIPEGWSLAEKYDTEEGLIALFIRRNEAESAQT